MKTVRIATGSPYDVLIGPGLLEAAGREIKGIAGQRYGRAALVTDSTVGPLYAAAVQKSLEAAGLEVHVFTFPSGEVSKQIDTVMLLIQFMAECSITRSDVLVALGGGVVGDMGGFAASVFLRGIDYVQLPTTLLAAVDSSVGGKTAVNIPAGKNLAGTFWQPRLVLCDTNTLSTLDDEAWGDGMAESIKYGCIWDQSLLEVFEGQDVRENLEEIIARCVDIKAQVVSRDERESGLRQILNFGHTAGHGIEKLSGFTVSHGRGVAAGMCIAAAAGEAAGLTPAGTAERIRRVLRRHGLPTSCDHEPATLAQACLGDKKRSGDTISYVLLQGIGKALIHPVPTAELTAFLAAAEER